MRVLVTGSGGQVGREVVQRFSAHEVVGVDHDRLDVGDRDMVLQLLSAVRPHIVVHTAAFTDVDACERAVEQAFRVNALGVRNVAEGARLVGAHLVHLSTDYVFSGDREGGYHEWDDPAPRSVYGRSKLGGERELGPQDTVVRTSWVCGRHGRNFVKTMLRLASVGEEVRVVADQVGCPTFAADLAAMIERLAVGRLPGVFHVTNQGPMSWYAFARAVFEAAGRDPARVRAITTDELDPPRAAPRPRCSVLHNTALRAHGLALLPPVAESLPALVASLA